MRDILLGHSLYGMDAYYIRPDADDLKRAMDTFTRWLDEKVFSENVDQSVDHA